MLPLCGNILSTDRWSAVGHSSSNGLRNFRLMQNAVRLFYRVMTLDNRGVGKSSAPRDPNAYTTSRMASDVVAVLNELAWDNAHIVGHRCVAYQLHPVMSNTIRSNGDVQAMAHRLSGETIQQMQCTGCLSHAAFYAFYSQHGRNDCCASSSGLSRTCSIAHSRQLYKWRLASAAPKVALL
jgi:hypothetical protein